MNYVWPLKNALKIWAFLALPSQHPPTCRDKCCIFINVQVTLFNAMVKLTLLIWVFLFWPCSSLGGMDNYKVQAGAMVYSGLWAVQFPQTWFPLKLFFTFPSLTLRYSNIFKEIKWQKLTFKTLARSVHFELYDVKFDAV